MRKIIALEFLSLDGVLQAPGGLKEDTSGGFAFGGWTVPFSDEFTGNLMSKQMEKPFDLLLGKKTYDIWASYWPYQDKNPTGNPINSAKKYVVTHSDFVPSWEGTVVLTGENIAQQIKIAKHEDRPDLFVFGSGNLMQTLLQHDLVDELWLKIFPVVLGPGKQLFAEGTSPAAFTLTDATVCPSGVIFANYKRNGAVQRGSFD